VCLLDRGVSIYEKSYVGLTKCAERLRAGEVVPDGEFDDVFPPEIEAVSFRHWTPVAVARRAAHLMADAGARRILDVGAGPGKFCIVGALTTDAHFTGLERRRNLVEEARRAAARLRVDRVHFAHANLLDFDSRGFDGFYLYNPFQEFVEADDPFPIDRTVRRSEALHKTYIAATIAMLIRAPVGTVVATFHGFGGPMPGQYRRLREERLFGAQLVLWMRDRNSIRKDKAGEDRAAA
jgi:SAM-dependent methyltransferase